jgi:hypothetical protein
MYWKFYKLLIIKSILIKSFWESRTLFSKRVLAAGGVYLPEGRHPIIPFFQHSIIPIAERSEAKFLLITRLLFL